MPIRTLRSTEEATSPTTGVLRDPLTCANARGKRPSSAAASGTRPWIMIHPFSAPKVEIIATAAISFAGDTPSTDAPNICRAASANGALECASVAAGITPMIATVASTYIAVVTTVPKIVARGSVRSGSLTSSAGTVADSRPMNAHRVSVAANEIACQCPISEA